MTSRLGRVVLVAVLMSAAVVAALCLPVAVHLARGAGVQGSLRVTGHDCLPGALCLEEGTFASDDASLEIEGVSLAGSARPTGDVVWLGGRPVVFPAGTWSPLIITSAALGACLLGSQRLVLAELRHRRR